MKSLSPWKNYDDAHAMFARIVPGQTSKDDLSNLGIAVASTPNVILLSHADLLRRLGLAAGSDLGLFDPELRACLVDFRECYALEIQESHTERVRVGNFFLDILNFRRHVEVTGWNFDALIILRGDKVVNKVWSGNPKVRYSEDERNPLGPLQGIGSSIVR